MSLTIAYCTARKEPRIEWFFDSLRNEMENTDTYREDIRVMVIDFWAVNPQARLPLSHYSTDPNRLHHWVQPKPSVWQGGHRLTKENWFAMASCRNTALCLCDTTHLSYCDDLSVLVPGWLGEAVAAASANTIVLGAYRKVKDLVVENGVIKSFTDYPQGHDNRLGYGTTVRKCRGEWLYGCSLVAPVEALLSVNGWPEDLCDSLGYEDCTMGICLENAGYKFIYNPRMMTYESEELHHVGKAFRKEDWHFEDGKPVVGGNGHSDKSHAALNIARASKYFPNSFGEGGIRELRRKVLAGEPWPIPGTPDREWYTKQLLSDL